jgi:NAD(P)-dependent dehydrogenase (short-subunit alcohol dehydrogenase family)
LAKRAWDRFGSVHLLFNNAGVAVAGPAWTATLEDWKWTLDINLMGVVHGIRAFVPRMLAQGGEAHIVNTASVAGLVDIPGSAVYCVSKHGVVALSECLHHDLRVAGAAIGVSVLCPAYVNTGIGDSARHRPAELAATNPLAAPYEEAVRQALRSGKLSAADIARATIEAVKAGRFYVIPHEKIKGAIETRMRDILDDRIPTDVSRPVPGARR